MVILTAVLALFAALAITGFAYWRDKPNRIGHSRAAGFTGLALLGAVFVLVLVSTVRGCRGTYAGKEADPRQEVEADPGS